MTPGERSYEPRTSRCWKHGPAPVIGLTGGVASGKSLVASFLAEREFDLIDADSVGHDVLDLPGVRQKLVDHFGPDVLAAGDCHRSRAPGQSESSGGDRLRRSRRPACPRGDRSSSDAGEVRRSDRKKARARVGPPAVRSCSMPRSCSRRVGMTSAIWLRSSTRLGPNDSSARPRVAAGRMKISQPVNGLNGPARKSGAEPTS